MSATKGIHSSILSNLNNWRHQGQGVDEYLACQKIRVPAHKNILAAASPYFRATFYGSFRAKKGKVLGLNEMDGSCLKAVVDYIYTSKLIIPKNKLEAMLELAGYLVIQTLVNELTDVAKRQMSANNCVHLLNLADQLNLNELAAEAKSYIRRNFDIISQTESFKDMTTERMYDMFEKDRYHFHCNERVVEALELWAKHSMEDRSEHLNILYQCIYPGVSIRKKPSTVPVKSGIETFQGSPDYEIITQNRKSNFVSINVGSTRCVHLKPLPKALHNFSLSGFRRSIYVQGGGSEGRNTGNQAFCYNMTNNEWIAIKPLIIERSFHRSIVLNNVIYTMGGRIDVGTTNTVECLNLATNQSYVDLPMPERNYSFGLCLKDEAMYVAAGKTHNRRLNSLQRYDPREGRWQTMKNLTFISGACSSATVDDSIFCVDIFGNIMERYDLRAQRCTNIPLPETQRILSIFNCSGKIFGNNANDLLLFDPFVNCWTKIFQFDFKRQGCNSIGLQIST